MSPSMLHGSARGAARPVDAMGYLTDGTQQSDEMIDLRLESYRQTRSPTHTDELRSATGTALASMLSAMIEVLRETPEPLDGTSGDSAEERAKQTCPEIHPLAEGLPAPDAAEERDAMSATGRKRPFQILLVEDNPADVQLTAAAMKRAGIDQQLSAVGNGEEAFAFLDREGAYADAPRPDLILLDINLPGMSGFEVLAEIKSRPPLKQIPVVMLSTSDSKRDIALGYDLQASFYIQKPMEFDDFVSIMQAMGSFWLSVAQLPE